MSNNRGGASHHGAALGKALSEIESKGRLINPNIPEKCNGCAFRLGTLANQSASTVKDAVGALANLDDAVFVCHHGLDEEGLPTRPCYGYEAAIKADKSVVLPILEDALQNLTPDNGIDLLAKEYWEWIEEIDPNNELDDYQRGRKWAVRKS